MAEKTNLILFSEGIFSKNPIFFMLLGLCPTLAVTTTLENGIGMGIATAFVLLFSSGFISLFRKFIPSSIRIPSFIVIIASFVTINSLLMEAFVPTLFNKLGIYIPLIVVNCIVLGKALSFAYKNPLIPSLFDAFGAGLGFTFALILIAALREIIGTGSIIFSNKVLFSISIIPMNLMLLPPGALLSLGLILGGFNFVKLKRKKNE